jgi:transcriptional regulator with PAS, ATPase and Fis domain
VFDYGIINIYKIQRGLIVKKIKVLVIAPYLGLKELINDISKEINNFEVDTYISDMYDGLMLSQKLEHKGYDLILSRAGTAELIRKESALPVIDIKISVLDMMKAIKLAQSYSGNFAIVGFETITKIAKQICELLQYEIKINTINHAEEIDETLLKLKHNGVGLIVGDVITTTHAKKIGLNTILITTGKECVLNAFNEAKILFDSIKKMKTRNMVIKNILENSNLSTLCFDEQNQIIYSNLTDDIVNLNAIVSDLKKVNETLLTNSPQKILKKYNNLVYLIKGILLEWETKKFFAYYIKNQTISIKPLFNAIHFSDIDNSPHINIDTFCSTSRIFQDFIKITKSYARLKSPIIIEGEKGTGKDAVAYSIYQNSLNNKNSLITIDSKYISEKQWTELFESEQSLFLYSGFTIYIKNIHLLEEKSQEIFESYLLNTNLQKRNKLIFSIIPEHSEKFKHSSLFYFIKNKMYSLPLIIPNLNQRREDIPNLVSLYLNELNLSYSKQVIGLEKGAINLLQKFDWKENIDQLKRIINELILLTDSSYIKYGTVEKILKNEVSSSSNSNVYNINLNKTLEEISNEILKIVLKEENYNLTAVSKRLGLSRSTLWRKVKYLKS